MKKDMAHGEIKCVECGKVSVPDRSKWGCEPDLCDECLSKGWVDDPKEVYDAIKNDKELSPLVDIESPLGLQDIL